MYLIDNLLIMNKLNPKALGLAVGVTFGVGFFLAGLVGMLFNYGLSGIEVAGSWYLGFAPTLQGSFLGLIWGFFDGLIGGSVIAALYNHFTK